VGHRPKLTGSGFIPPGKSVYCLVSSCGHGYPGWTLGHCTAQWFDVISEVVFLLLFELSCDECVFDKMIDVGSAGD
jgi:hypothetical protein